MELRDYLMPGEYVITILDHIKVDGIYDNLAITNKRILLFKTSKSGLLQRKSTEITSLKSYPLEGVEEVSIQITNKGSLRYYIRLHAVDKNRHVVISLKIDPKIGRIGLREVYSILWTTFESVSTRYETNPREELTIFYLQ